MYCLDSDVLIDFLCGEKQAVHFVLENKDLCTTVINAQEILFGVDKENTVIKDFFENIPIFSYDEPSLKYVVGIQKYLYKKGSPIGSFDEIIAGICLAHDLTLVTRNKKHFSRISSLKTVFL